MKMCKIASGMVKKVLDFNLVVSVNLVKLFAI